MRSEPFSTVDAAWLGMEHPTNLMMVTAVLLLEAPLDLAGLREGAEQHLLQHDRFRQRAGRSLTRLGARVWGPDPSFDLDAHLHHVALPAPGGRRALERLVGDLMSTPLDYSKPLWQIHLVDGVDADGAASAVVARLHHAIGDGFALVRVLLSITEGAER